MNTRHMIPPTADTAETVTLRHVPQESVSLYEAISTDGDVVALLLAEAVENPARFEQRTEAERSAMQVLALDEYYKGTDWEGTILDD
jgi:hypothetical protein